MPSVFTADPEDLESSRSDESEEWPDNDDVMTEIKKWVVFGNTPLVLSLPVGSECSVYINPYLPQVAVRRNGFSRGDRQCTS